MISIFQASELCGQDTEYEEDNKRRRRRKNDMMKFSMIQMTSLLVEDS